VTDLPPERRSVGIVFQDHALFPHMSVRANVAYGPKVRGLSPREASKTADRFLEMTRLGHLAERKPASLSGGEKQRVALSRALAIEPDILLLDEPFSALDAALRLSLRREVRRIQEATGITAVLVTHDQDEALSLADELAVMREGRIVQQASPADLWKDPVDLSTALFLGRASRLAVGKYAVDGSGNLVAETASGPVRLPAGAVPPPLPATVVFRPENVSYDPNGPLSASLVSCEYAGGMLKCRLNPENPAPGDAIEMDWPADSEFPRGKAALRLSLADGTARVLPGESVDGA
jgi:putative spermidine/putrescine transport system ATP-binding protein